MAVILVDADRNVYYCSTHKRTIPFGQKAATSIDPATNEEVVTNAGQVCASCAFDAQKTAVAA